MSRRNHFTKALPFDGNRLPASTFGRLVATFQSASPIPLRGGQNTGRHIYLALKNADGVFECAVNIRSDEGTTVLFAERLEQQPPPLDPGFSAEVRLSYATGPSDGATEFMGLNNDAFQPIQNDALFDRIRGLATDCRFVEVYGMTYSGGDGIHDVHMNSGTDPSDRHHADDAVDQDGAIAFHVGDGAQAFAHWIFVRFTSQTIPAAQE